MNPDFTHTQIEKFKTTKLQQSKLHKTKPKKTKPNTLNRNKLSREDIILQTAIIIAKQGLHQLTMRSLAKRLNCSVGTLPHYFSGKDEIVEAALNWSSERILNRIKNINFDEAKIDTFTPIIKSTLPFDKQADLEWRVRLALWNYATSNTTMRKVVKELSDSNIALLCTWIAILQEKGEIRADMPISTIAHTLYNLVNGLAFNLLHISMCERSQHLSHIMDYLQSLKP